MSKYDVAVVGSGIGGLAAAALLSCRGKKTLILAPGSVMHDALGMAENNGFTFFAAPALSHGFETGGAFRKLFDEVGFTLEPNERSNSYQVALPNRRITIYPETDRVLEELNREFPHEIVAIRKFYRDIRTESLKSLKSRLASFLMQRRSAKGFIRRFRFSAELMAFYDVQARFFYARPIVNLQVSELIELCNGLPQRNYYGFQRLVNHLCGIVQRTGGRIIHDDTNYEFLLKKNRVVGLKSASTSFEAKCILMNGHERQQPQYLAIGIREEVIPSRMCPDVIYLPNYEKPQELMSICVSTESDGAAQKGMRALNALFLPRNVAPLQRQDMLARISDIVPFLTEYIVHTEQPHAFNCFVSFPADTTWKAIRTENTEPLLFRASNKNVYRLVNKQEMPMRSLVAANYFVNKIY